MARSISIAMFVALLLLACLAGCDSRPTSQSVTADSDVPIAEAIAEVATDVVSAGNAQLALGDESYQLDSITCIGTSMATAVAADRANRDGYPNVTLRTFDPAITGGVDSNTASIQFRSTTRDELWLLNEGSVTRDGNTFEAAGSVTGTQMVTQPDGTLKSQPLEGVSEQPFNVFISCR